MEQARGEFIPREELERRLTALGERNLKALPLFAARCAMRAFPLLAVPEDFDFWPEQERTLNLLAVWRALMLALSGEWMPSQAVTGARRAAAAAQGFLAGGEGSALQGEVLKWSTLVAVAAQVAQAAAVPALSAVEQVALAIGVAQTVHPFLVHLAGEDTTAVVLQELDQWESMGADIVQASPLWLGLAPSSRFVELAFERLPQQLQQRAKRESRQDSLNIRLITGIADRYRALLERGYPVPEAQQDLSALNRYFDSPAATSGTAPSTTVTASAKVAQEPWDETQVVKAIPDLETLASTVPGKIPLDETLFQEFPPKAPAPAESAPEKAAVDALLQRELSYRPSDRHSIEQISEVDHLNRGQLVQALATVLTAPGNESHQTIGLLGDWGVGKSTLVHLLKNELVRRQEQQPFLFAEFNAWAYEHTDNLQAGIAQEMLKALSSDMPRPKGDVAPAATLPAKVRKWWDGFLSQSLWLCKRVLITCRFAIALNGWRMLWLLLMLLVAVLPFTWGDVGETLVGLATESGTTSAGDAVAATLGTGIWVAGFIYYFVTRLKPVLANPFAKELLTYLKLPDYGEHLGAIPVMRKNIETLCRVRLKSQRRHHKDKRLLFVVDDLDRCGHEGIVKVLEAVRLVLDLKRVTVIIAVDQRIALAALALHYKDLAEHHQLQNPRAIARDYLAKVIHLPILLSPPDDKSIEGYLNHIWQEQTGDVSVALSTPEQKPVAPTSSADASAGNARPVQQANAAPPRESTPANGTAPVTDAGPTPAGNVIPLRPSVNASTASNASAATPDPGNNPAPSPDKPAPLVVPGLSTLQKQAFLHWVKHFHLTNPRQLKRLHNSYNLLRHFYGEDNAGPAPATVAELVKTLEFPLMVTLFALECLNSLDDPPRRAQLKARLRGRSEKPFSNEAEPEADGQPFSAAVIALVNRRMPVTQVHLVDAVEPFVLPAIEQDVVRESQAQSEPTKQA